MHQLEYKALPNADSNVSLHKLYYRSFLLFEFVQDLTVDLIRIHQHIIRRDEYIEHLSFHFFFAVYRDQEQKMICDQYIRANGTTIQNILLLQRNVNKYYFINPSYAKLSAIQEKENGR